MRNISEAELGLISGGTSEIVDYLLNGPAGRRTAVILEPGRLQFGDNTYSVTASTGASGFDLQYTLESESDPNISHEISDQIMERLLGFETFLPQEVSTGTAYQDEDGNLIFSGQNLVETEQFERAAYVKAEPDDSVISYEDAVIAQANLPNFWADLDGDGEVSLAEFDTQMDEVVASLTLQSVTSSFAALAGTTDSALTYEDMENQLMRLADASSTEGFELVTVGDLISLTHEMKNLKNQAEQDLKNNENLANLAIANNGVSDVAEIVNSVLDSSGVSMTVSETLSLLDILGNDPTILNKFDADTPLLGADGYYASLGIDAADENAPEGPPAYDTYLQFAKSLELPLGMLGLGAGQSIAHSAHGLDFEITRTAELTHTALEFGLDADTQLYATYTAQFDGLDIAIAVALQGDNNTPMALVKVA